MKKVPVTATIPCWNHGSTLVKLCSQLGRTQGVLPSEVVVVDDGSSPEKGVRAFEADIRAPLETAGVRVTVDYAEHKGAPAARNRAIAQARHGVLFFCDADIDLYPDCLRKLWDRAAETGVDLVHCKFRSRGGVVGQELDREKLRRGNFITGTALVRKSAVPREGWDETLRRYQDWELWQRMLIRDARSASFVDEVLFDNFPQSPNSITLNSISAAEAHREVLERMKAWSGNQGRTT